MKFTHDQKLEIIKEIKSVSNKEIRRQIADKYGIPQAKIYGWMGGFESNKSNLKHKEFLKKSAEFNEFSKSST